jgi:hypothetical protein
MQISDKLCLSLPHEIEKNYSPVYHFAHADSL